jgi:V/A-type H+-transporting ATPase subunit D
MMRGRVAVTRSNLLRLRAQLIRVRKGGEIIRRQRQGLVTHLFKVARPALDSRMEIARHATDASTALLDALAGNGYDGLRALAAPDRAIEVEIRPSQIWGVAVADVERIAPVHRTLDARGNPPGSSGESVARAADEYEELVDLLIGTAATEVRVTRLAEAVALASQRMRVLQERVEPRLVGDVGLATATLEEREREEHFRLKQLNNRRQARRSDSLLDG